MQLFVRGGVRVMGGRFRAGEGWVLGGRWVGAGEVVLAEGFSSERRGWMDRRSEWRLRGLCWKMIVFESVSRVSMEIYWGL